MADETTTETTQVNTEAAESSETTATSWTDGFGDLKGNDHLKAYEKEENVGALAKDYVALKDASPVIPENADGYKIDIPDGTQMDEAVLGDFKKAAHEHGLTNAQFSKIVEFDIKRQAQIQANFDASRTKIIEDATATLKTDWSDKYDENLATANKAIDMFGGEELSNVLKELQLDNHPMVVRAFYNIGNAISEGTFKAGIKNPLSGPKLGPGGKRVLEFPSMEQ